MKKKTYFLGVCATSPCDEGEGSCLNNDECTDNLICGADGICSNPCSIVPCDFDEGDCHGNEECKDALICGSNMLCKSKIRYLKYTYNYNIYI